MSDFMSNAVGEHLRCIQPWPSRFRISNKGSDGSISNVGHSAGRAVGVSRRVAENVSPGCHYWVHLLDNEDPELWFSILHPLRLDTNSLENELYLPLRSFERLNADASPIIESHLNRRVGIMLRRCGSNASCVKGDECQHDKMTW